MFEFGDIAMAAANIIPRRGTDALPASARQGHRPSLIPPANEHQALDEIKRSKVSAM